MYFSPFQNIISQVRNESMEIEIGLKLMITTEFCVILYHLMIPVKWKLKFSELAFNGVSKMITNANIFVFS